MFSHLIRKELLEQLLSLRFAMACIICLVITISSAVVLTKDYKEALADFRTSTVIHKNELEEGGDLWGQGVVVDRPMNLLQIFVQGVEREMTASARVTMQQEPQDLAEHEDNPVSFLFPPIDMLSFIGVVMSLLAIAFGYDAVSGEKESGTLKLLMSYSTPRDTVLLAKWIGGYLALAAPFLLSVVCSLVVVLLFPDVELVESDWLGLICLIGVGLVYLAAVYSMGVFVSARTHQASTSITVLLMVWVLMILVVPNVSPYVAVELVPLRDFTQIDGQKRVFEDEQQERFERTIEAYAEDNPDIERWGDDGRWGAKWNLLERDRLLELIDAHRKIDTQFMNELRQQISVAKQLSRLSPYSSFAYAAAGLAGTDIRERHRFQESLTHFRRELTPYTTELLSEAWREGRQNERRDFSGRPQYEYAQTSIRERLNGVLVDVLILAGWSVVFFMGAYLSFLRYDVM